MIEYVNPEGKRIRKTFSTKKQAVAERATRVSLMHKGEYGEFVEKKKSYTATFGDMVKLYEENHQDQTSYKTAKKFFIEKFKNHFKEETLLSSIGQAPLCC